MLKDLLAKMHVDRAMILIFIYIMEQVPTSVEKKRVLLNLLKERLENQD